MGVVPQPQRILPNPRVTRTYGILNIVFSTLLLLCGLCYSVQIAVMPTVLKAMGQVQVDLKNRTESLRDQRLKSLDEEAKAAKTDKEKARIAERKKSIENAPVVPVTAMPDLNAMGLSDPKMQIWSWAELLTGLIVNLLFLTSGIGLLSCKPWAWKFAIYTSALKIARLCILYTLFVVVIVPPFARNMGNAVVTMMTQQQLAAGRGAGSMPPADVFIKIYTITYSIMGVGVIVFGSIYPLVLLWGLTRPGVRAACLPWTSTKPVEDIRQDELS